MDPIVQTWQQGLESSFRLQPDELKPNETLDCVVLIKNDTNGFLVFETARILKPVLTMLPGMGGWQIARGYTIHNGDEVVQIQPGALTITLRSKGSLGGFANWESVSISYFEEPKYVPAWLIGLSSDGRQDAICIKVGELKNFKLSHLPLLTRFV